MAETSIKLTFRARVVRDGAEPFTVTCHGRMGWAVLSLLRAGKRGCTPIDRPAPRWSDYIFKARGVGLSIETVHEPHGGNFPGHHARYIMHDRLEVFGGTLERYLQSPEGRREFPDQNFARAV